MRYSVERLPVDHPLRKSPHGHAHGRNQNDDIMGVVDAAVVDTHAKHPMKRSMCFATYVVAIDIADRLNELDKVDAQDLLHAR